VGNKWHGLVIRLTTHLLVAVARPETAAASPWRCGHGCLNPSEMRGGARQCAILGALGVLGEALEVGKRDGGERSGLVTMVLMAAVAECASA
jgi:hypothetical protein